MHMNSYTTAVGATSLLCAHLHLFVVLEITQLTDRVSAAVLDTVHLLADRSHKHPTAAHTSNKKTQGHNCNPFHSNSTIISAKQTPAP